MAESTKNAQSTTVARREREKAQRREDILQAAREVFFERGIDHATIDEVAEQAGVGKGTLYLYFDSKDAILANLLLDGLDLLVNELAAAYAPRESISASMRLLRLAQAYLKFFQNHPPYLRLLLAFDRGGFKESTSDELYAEMLSRSRRGFEWLVRAFEQGKQDGTLVVHHPNRAAALMWAGVNGVLVLLDHPLRREMIGDDVESMYRAMVDALIAGLTNAGPARGRVGG